jgi:hypothetical protein
MRTTLVALLTAAVFAAPAGAQAPEGVGPDYVTSPNVEYLGFIKDDIGQTTGSRIVGNRLYVTSAKNLSIYDITDPAKPARIGLMHINIAWENEEVPTNGKILGISSDWITANPNCSVSTACQQFFDVRDPENIKELPSLPSGDHTADCALDCSYMFGNTGTITDLRGVLDGPAVPKVIGNWQTLIKPQLAARGYKDGVRSCHHIREIKPGVMMAACQPFVVFHITGGEGAAPLSPVVTVVGGNDDKRFVHSARWPRQGTDKFALVGGETNFSITRHQDLACDEKTDAAFTVVDASHSGQDGRFSQPLDEYRPKNGTYVDGNSATEIAGCSVHWYQEHESFHNGGLVALASYDNGMRFLQVKPDGKIVEQGYFQPLGFETSAPRWVPGTNIVYSIDYARGIDILRWKGDTYVPSASGKVKHKKGKVRGTNGKQPLLPALTAAQRAFATREVSLLRAQGWFQGYCELAARRYGTAS